MQGVMRMRAFMAIEIDFRLINKIIKVQEALKNADAPVKFVDGENLHFTVKFFGDITPDQVQQISSLTNDQLINQKSFQMHIKGTGVFPNLKRPRVLWLGVEDPQEFSQLQRRLDEEWVRMGFRRERSYIPHLTIGRVKGSRNRDALISKIHELEGVDIGPIAVEKLVLRKSELTPVGPIYTDLQEFPLA
jgi:2'-5' RNA ligase